MNCANCTREIPYNPYYHPLCPGCRVDESGQCCFCRKRIKGKDLIEGRSVCGGCKADLLEGTGLPSVAGRVSRLREDFEAVPPKKNYARERLLKSAKSCTGGKVVNASFVRPKKTSPPTT